MDTTGIGFLPLFGLVIVVFGPAILNALVLGKMRKSLPVPRQLEGEITGLWVGIIERCALAPIVWLAPDEAITVLGGWIAIKLAASWGEAQKIDFKGRPKAHPMLL